MADSGARVQLHISQEAAEQRNEGNTDSSLRNLRSMRKEGKIDMSKARGLSRRIQEALLEYDKDHDGLLDMDEVAALMEGILQREQKMKYMKIAIIFLIVFTLILLGAMFGLTWAVVAALKDTRVEPNGYMYTKGSNTELVKVASADTMVSKDGMLVQRQMPTSMAAALPSTSLPQPLRVTTVAGVKQRFSSQLDIRYLMELNYLYIEGGDEAQLALQVNAVARVKQAGSIHSTVVKILTAAGTITLDDTSIIFTEDMAPIFKDGGFIVAQGGRRLLGVYDVFGFFRFIEDLTVFNLPKDEPKPALPQGDYKMELRVYEPCMLPSAPTEDRCKWVPPPEPLPNEKVRAQLRRALLEGLGEERGRRLLAEPGYESGPVDLPGVVLYGSFAKRYMLHNETVVQASGNVRTVYQYASVPDYLRVEVVNLATRMGGVWQEQAPLLKKDPNNASEPARVPQKAYCNAFQMPPSMLDSFSSLRNTSAVNFTFIGYEDLEGIASRHFKLTIQQNNTEQAEIVVDYWDQRKNRFPLLFDFNHAKVGHIFLRVINFTILPPGSAETSVALFTPPVPERDCIGPRGDTVIQPRIGSAFTQPTEPLEDRKEHEVPRELINLPPNVVYNFTYNSTYNITDFFYNASINASTLPARRSTQALLDLKQLSDRQLKRLLRHHIELPEHPPDFEAHAAAYKVHMERAAEWAALDHASGNVQYPEWAKQFFAVHDGSTAASTQAVRRNSMESSRRVLMEGIQGLAGGNAVQKRSGCGYWTGLGPESEGQVDPLMARAYEGKARHTYADGAVVGRSIQADNNRTGAGRSLLQQWNPPEICNQVTGQMSIPMGGACDLTLSQKYKKYLAVDATCSSSIAGIPGIKFAGSVEIDLCEASVAGCIAIKMSLTELCCGWSNNKAVKTIADKLGITDIDILKICGGYSWRERTGFVTGTYSGPPLWLWLAKADLYATAKFSKCCAWMEKVGLEAHVGIHLWFWSYYSSVGSIDFVKDMYFKGSPDEQSAAASPEVDNKARVYVVSTALYQSFPQLAILLGTTVSALISPTAGFWGDWSAWSYCYKENPGGGLLGIPMRGYRLRVEDPGGDDTALNAVEVMCSDETRMSPHDGVWGGWKDWAWCPPGAYIVGARMRLEGGQGGGDDTAANSIQFRCNTGHEILSHGGFWGGWTGWVVCPQSTFACGLQVRFEREQGAGDDTALNGLNIQCCSLGTEPILIPLG